MLGMTKSKFVDTVSKTDVYDTLAKHTELSLEDLTVVNNVIMSMHHGNTQNEDCMVTWNRLDNGEVFLIIDEFKRSSEL